MSICLAKNSSTDHDAVKNASDAAHIHAVLDSLPTTWVNKDDVINRVKKCFLYCNMGYDTIFTVRVQSLSVVLE
jgi:hypothetical protein